MKIGRQQTKCESVTDWLDNVSGQYHGDSNLQGGPKNISLLFLQACFLAHPVDISMVLTRDYRANLSQIHTFDAEDKHGVSECCSTTGRPMCFGDCM